MRKLFIVLIIGLFLAPIIAEAQALEGEFPRAQSLFARGQRLMREKDYPGATDAFNELVKGFKNSQYRDIYNFALARAYYHSGDYSQTAQTLGNYHTLFPNSSLLPYAYQLRANALYRMGQLEASFVLYGLAYRTTGDSRLRMLAERSILATVEDGFVPPDSIMAEMPSELLCPIKTRVAYLVTGHWSQEQIDSLLGNCPRETEAKPRPKAESDDLLAIGVMLPLSGPFAKYGQSILDGIMLATENLRRMGLHSEVYAYDTKADHVTAARIAMAMSDLGVDVIIGPLLSNIAATVAAGMSTKNIPLLVPAASQAGFTDLSPACFQMSANMETIGRGLAQYAVTHRGMTTLAVISPTSLDELTMAEAFVDEAERRGAHIIAFEKFRSGETDFGPYINDIKEAILGPPVDSLFYITLEGDTLKSGEMPVHLNGLFIPATEDQLYLILPQLNFYRVSSSYLGTSEWDTDKVIKLGEKVLGDAVFYSTNSAMHTSMGYEAFAEYFDGKYGAPPDRLSSLGYDAVNLLATAYRAGRRGPGDYIKYFSSVKGFAGASGMITFGRTRTNIELPLFKLEDDQVVPIIERPTIEELPADSLPPDSIGTQYIKYEW